MSKGIRVHELAKEFKISTAALKKHLQDLGVSVKSHMSVVDVDVVGKIRSKFNEQKAAIKRRDTDRQKYHKHSDPAKQESKKNADNKSAKDFPTMPKLDDDFSIDTDDLPKGYKRHKDDKPQQRNGRNQQKNTSAESTGDANDNSSRNTVEKRPERKKYDFAEQRRNREERSRNNDDRQPNSDNRPQGDRPNYRNDRNGSRPQGDRPNYRNDRNGSRPQGDRPNYRNDNRPQGDRPNYRNDRNGSRPQGDRPNYRNDNRPQGDRPNYRNDRNGSRPQGDRPNFRNDRNGTRPQGDRPNRGPRPVNKGYKPATTTPVVDPPKRANKFDKDKKFISPEDKNKHLKAKLRVTKQRKQKYRPTEAEEAGIAKSIKAMMAGPKKKNKKKYKVQKEERQQIVQEQKAKENSKITISEFTSVSELAKLMDVAPSEIVGKFFGMGQMVTINQRLDKDALEMICDEFEFEVTFQDEYGTDLLEETLVKHSEDAEEEERPPVVTIMGHVDHGKTSILDYIRNENIVAGESGGITQHIGAYQVEYNQKKITFLDTPGHEAFTAMRARGANVTDIAIIVVAANDGVMPQTIEAIDHARAAGVSIIVAINKIDLPEANPSLAIHGLSEQNLYLENWGGEVPYVECSAKTGAGISDLLDYILLTSEMGEYKAKVGVPAKGVVIESQKDQRTGTYATILVQEGSLKKGDNIVCGATHGRVRKLENERQSEINEMGPSDVAVIFGLDDVPKAGDFIHKVDSDKIARQISSERKQIRMERQKYQTTTSASNIFDKIREHQMSELKIILKADTDGSVEALADSFQKLSNEEVTVNIIHKSVGGIIEADVTLAAASEAIIIGFHVRSNNQAKRLADEQNVIIKNYQIIYDAINDVKASLSGMLAPVMQEQFLGNVLVKQVFRIKKVGQIAGAAVEKGKILRTAKLRLFRNNIMIHEGNVSSLKHYSQDVDEVKAGTECGIGIENYNDIKEGDVIEAYQVVEVERKL